MLGEKFKLREVETKYGVIYARDALLVLGHSLSLSPLQLIVNVNLSLSGCRPERNDASKVDLIFEFRKIKNLSIYMIDDYPYEKYSCSSFDEYLDERGNGVGRYVLSTYDHVFDVRGECSLIEV